MTTPTPRTIHTVCPACGKGHDDSREFGPYCNLQCLTLAMTDRVELTTEAPPCFADRSQIHAS